jgi:hypothetical protein
MRRWRRIRRRGVAQKAIEAALRAGKLAIEGPEKFREPLQSGRPEDINLQPQAVLRLVPRATTLDAEPRKPSKLLQYWPQRPVRLAEDIGIGHELRITGRRTSEQWKGRNLFFSHGLNGFNGYVN